MKSKWSENPNPREYGLLLIGAFMGFLIVGISSQNVAAGILAGVPSGVGGVCLVLIGRRIVLSDKM